MKSLMQLADKLQQADKNENLQQVCGIFGYVHKRESNNIAQLCKMILIQYICI